jgi:hypothetical protein
MKTFRWSLFSAFLFALSVSVHAGVGVGTSLFEKGRTRMTLSAGTGTSFNNSYLRIGVGAGYFVAPGLELGLDGEAWTGASPAIYQYSPGIRYVYPHGERMWPYIGAFFRRTIYEDNPDLSSLGGRAGVYTSLGGKAYAGVGGIYESYMDCDSTRYSTCSEVRPEVFVGVSF